MIGYGESDGSPPQKKCVAAMIKQTDAKKNTAGADRKPNSVPGFRLPAKPGDDHSSKGAGCPAPPATYPEAWTGRPHSLPYLVLHLAGFTKLFRSPGKLVGSYPTVSPLPCAPARERVGGMLSVALSFASPRLRVTERHTLRCSDFPPT